MVAFRDLRLRETRELGSVEIAGGPDAIWLNPTNNRVYMAIGEPGLVQVIDDTALTVIEAVETGLRAQTTAFGPRCQ